MRNEGAIVWENVLRYSTRPCPSRLNSGGHGQARVAQLTVVVVLDDIPLRGLCGPRQQRIAAADGHDNARRIVVRRGNMGDLRTAGPQCFHGQALAVKADGADGHIVRRVDAGNFAVAGVLDGIAQPAPEELHDEAIKVLRARADEDLLRRDAQAARLLQMGRNGSAQFRRTGKNRPAASGACPR